MLSSALCTAFFFFLSCAIFAVGGCWVVLMGVGLLWLAGLESIGLKLWLVPLMAIVMILGFKDIVRIDDHQFS
jgi:hypothetical protein